MAETGMPRDVATEAAGFAPEPAVAGDATAMRLAQSLPPEGALPLEGMAPVSAEPVNEVPGGETLEEAVRSEGAADAGPAFLYLGTESALIGASEPSAGSVSALASVGIDGSGIENASGNGPGAGNLPAPLFPRATGGSWQPIGPSASAAGSAGFALVPGFGQDLTAAPLPFSLSLANLLGDGAASRLSDVLSGAADRSAIAERPDGIPLRPEPTDGNDDVAEATIPGQPTGPLVPGVSPPNRDLDVAGTVETVAAVGAVPDDPPKDMSTPPALSAGLMLIGTDGADTLLGGSGNDTLMGLGGNDTLIGDDGNDTLIGDQGNDTLFDGGGDDLIRIDGGDHVWMTGSGNDVATLNGGSVVMMGAGSSADWSIYYDPALSTLIAAHAVFGSKTFVLNGGRLDMFDQDTGLTYPDYVALLESMGGGGTGGLRHFGSSADDTISGGAGDDVLKGRGGDDRLFGGDGDDDLDGDIGDDTLEGGSGDDTLTGGDGNDRLVADAGNDTLYDGAGDDTLVITGGVNTWIGGTGNDDVLLDGAELTFTPADATGFEHLIRMGPDYYTLYHPERGTKSFTVVNGGQLNMLDTINGLAGEDVTNEGEPGMHAILGSQFDDSVIGRAEDEVFMPGLDGIGAGNDVYSGLGGNDMFAGGVGLDTFIGGTGSDGFLVAGPGDGVYIGDHDTLVGDVATDVFVDFVRGEDVLAINGAGFGGLTDAQTEFAAIDAVYDGTNGPAGGQTLFHDAAGYVIYDDNGAQNGYTILAKIEDGNGGVVTDFDSSDVFIQDFV